MELGTVYAKLGSKVTVVEALPQILTGNDPDCVRVVANKLKTWGVEVMLNAKAKSWEKKGDRAVVTVTTASGDVQLDADRVLVTVGRRPNTDGSGVDKLGLKMEKGFIVTDAQLRTNVPGVYAIGDCATGMMLAHKATKEAEVCAEAIAGRKSAMDVRTIPAVVFTDPEIASTKTAGRKTKAGKFNFAVLGRSLSVNDPDGFVKVVSDAETEELLGVHIVGGNASDIISEAALAIEMGAFLHDLSLTVHPHPTLPEALMEAAKVVLGEAIHAVNR
jgi:dihydrolipoamide dehydrogenase